MKRFAIPTYDGVLTAHFGHCEKFAFIDVDDNGKIIKEEFVTPPEHQPGLFPKWVGQDMKANTVLAGGMGQMAQNLFHQNGVEVIAGVEPNRKPAEVVKSYLENNLETDAKNLCDH